jgi:hypothetical protein
MPCSADRGGESVRKSQPDGTHPLPDTAELGGEGGSFGDSASRESRKRGGEVRGVDHAISDLAGNATRLPEVRPEDQPAAGKDIKKHPTEP